MCNPTHHTGTCSFSFADSTFSIHTVGSLILKTANRNKCHFLSEEKWSDICRKQILKTYHDFECTTNFLKHYFCHYYFSEYLCEQTHRLHFPKLRGFHLLFCNHLPTSYQKTQTILSAFSIIIYLFAYAVSKCFLFLTKINLISPNILQQMALLAGACDVELPNREMCQLHAK